MEEAAGGEATGPVTARSGRSLLGTSPDPPKRNLSETRFLSAQAEARAGRDVVDCHGNILISR